ncbi:PIG-L deacetylase family protein [Streptomyces sp. NPDC001920]
MTERKDPTTAVSRRRALAAGALTAAAVAHSSLWTPSRASAAAAPPAIFYSPHQDDEAIGMAGSILEHKAAGRPVYLVLVSLGENDGLAHHMNSGECYLRTRCAAPGHRHNLNWPTDGTSKVVPARTAEFMASAKALGVDKVINFKVPDSAHDKATYPRFVDAVAAKVTSLARQYPGASHKFTAGWLEITGTHKALSDVAYRLMNDGRISDVRFNHIYAYQNPIETRARGAAYVLNIPSAHMRLKRNAIYAYNTWDPSRNLYALGYHSVPDMMESAHADPREFVHTLPSNYRPGMIG